jgi:hypothetical protein
MCHGQQDKTIWRVFVIHVGSGPAFKNKQKA